MSLCFSLLLLQAVAHDRDLGFNGDLLYVISAGNEDSVFNIDMRTGVIKVDSFLDREVRAEYDLNITVFDQGKPAQSSSRMVHIRVRDTNDNAPVFAKSSFAFFFPENTLKDTTVVTLNATDPDEGVFGQV